MRFSLLESLHVGPVQHLRRDRRERRCLCVRHGEELGVTGSVGHFDQHGIALMIAPAVGDGLDARENVPQVLGASSLLGSEIEFAVDVLSLVHEDHLFAELNGRAELKLGKENHKYQL